MRKHESRSHSYILHQIGLFARRQVTASFTGMRHFHLPLHAQHPPSVLNAFPMSPFHLTLLSYPSPPSFSYPYLSSFILHPTTFFPSFLSQPHSSPLSSSPYYPLTLPLTFLPSSLPPSTSLSRSTLPSSPSPFLTLLFRTSLFLFLHVNNEQPHKGATKGPYIGLFVHTDSELSEADPPSNPS